MSTDPETMANHWWWRPGWRVGRRFYAWHLVFDNQPDVQRLLGAYRTALAGLPNLDLIPDQWLHCTLQGIGFCDEIPESDVAAIVDAAQTKLAVLPAIELRFDAPAITPEAIESFAQPAAPVVAVRNALRAAIGDVLPTVPEEVEGFHPHVSIAYSSGDGPAAPYRAALDSVTVPSATATITTADLIVMHRDRRMYEWQTYARAPLA